MVNESSAATWNFWEIPSSNPNADILALVDLTYEPSPFNEDPISIPADSVHACDVINAAILFLRGVGARLTTSDAKRPDHPCLE